MADPHQRPFWCGHCACRVEGQDLGEPVQLLMSLGPDAEEGLDQEGRGMTC